MILTYLQKRKRPKSLLSNSEPLYIIHASKELAVLLIQLYYFLVWYRSILRMAQWILSGLQAHGMWTCSIFKVKQMLFNNELKYELRDVVNMFSNTGY